MKAISERLRIHIEQSRLAVAANRAKGNRHGQLLSVLYAADSRFLDELLQNAEDALRRRQAPDEDGCVRFVLYPNRLEFTHRGRDFDDEDLISITTFANSTKPGLSDVNLIGKFGIGFKSVFSVTDSPEIHSNGQSWRIDDYELLVALGKADTIKEGETKIVLPFKAGREQEFYRKLRDELQQIDGEQILFLKQIDCIKIEIATEEKKRVLKRRVENLFPGIYGVTIVRENSSIQKLHYLMFCEEARVGVFAFACDGDFRQVFSLEKSRVYNGLPGFQSSGLRFHVNAPFTSSPSRDVIVVDKRKTPENIRLLHKLSFQLRACLRAFRRYKLLSPELIAVLPLRAPEMTDSSDFRVLMQQHFFSEVKAWFQSGNTLPGQGRGYVQAKDAAFVAENDLMALLKRDDLKILFYRSDFLRLPEEHASLQRFRAFCIHELNIPEIGWEKFAFSYELFTAHFSGKSNQWFINLYRSIFHHTILWNEESAGRYFSFRTRPFLKVQGGQLMAPYSHDGHLQVFLKSRFAPKILTAFSNNLEVKAFLTQLGLRDATPSDEIQFGILPLFSGNTFPDVTIYQQAVRWMNRWFSFDKELFTQFKARLFAIFPFPFIDGTLKFAPLSDFLSQNAVFPAQPIEGFDAAAFQQLKKLHSLLAKGMGLVPLGVESSDNDYSIPGKLMFELADEQADFAVDFGPISAESLAVANTVSAFMEDRSPSDLKKRALKEFLRQYISRHGGTIEQAPKPPWDTMISDEEGRRVLVALFVNPPLENSFGVSRDVFLESYKHHLQNEVNRVYWVFCLWKGMNRLSFRVVYDPVGKVLAGTMDFKLVVEG